MKPIDAREVYSLSEFQRNAKKMITHAKETRRPMLLTVNGLAEVVVMDAVEYQALVSELEKKRFIAAVQEGLDDVKAGRTIPAEELYERFESRNGI